MGVAAADALRAHGAARGCVVSSGGRGGRRRAGAELRDHDLVPLMVGVSKPHASVFDIAHVSLQGAVAIPTRKAPAVEPCKAE